VLLLPTFATADQEGFEQRQDLGRNPRTFQPSPDVDILIATSKPYDNVIQRIQAVKGVVRYEYEHIDAIAATIPAIHLNNFKNLPEIYAIEKDREISLDTIRDVYEDNSMGLAAHTYEIDAAELSGDVVGFTEVAPDGYFPTEVDAMRASDFWNVTGHFGEGVIVGIMDSGTANVAAISGRVIGGESFLSANPPLDDGLPPNSPLNGPHGTWVATTLGANVIFGFLSTSSFVRAIKNYIPEAVLPDFFAPGIDGVPMVGPAPEAEFFALKVFNVSGRTSNSILLAGFDRAIELKQLYDQGDPAGVNLRVLNGSFSGGSLYAADDPFFAGMIAAVNGAGIVTCFSASNDGPGTMTIGDPGSARNTLTVGSTSIASYERILRDVQFGPGLGAMWRATDGHQIAESSSRGPTADGRWDPDIVAPGANVLAQGASGSINIVSGTSFSAPNVAGCAALLISNNPSMTPDEVRGKLLNGANPNLLDDNPTIEDQGFGFVDALAALSASNANPPDVGAEFEDVADNIAALGLMITDEDHFMHTTDWLVPGEGHEIFIEISEPHTSLSVSITVEQENDPANQNALFGDSGLFSLTNSWTHFGTYYTVQLVSAATAISIPESALDFGLVRINLAADDDNAGRVRLTAVVDKEKGAPVASQNRIAKGKVGQSETDIHAFEVPMGLTDLTLYLSWGNGWNKWPTNDLDLILVDPDGFLNFAGATLSTPERVFLENPTPGVWTAFVQGFTVWPNESGDVTEPYKLASSVDLASKASGELVAERTDAVPTRFDVGQNYPNPFNPSTTIAYALSEASDVTIEIFDVRGTRIAELVNEHQQPGFHRVTWHGLNQSGVAAPSGVYFYKVRAGEQVMQKRMMLLK
jgi:hypothetical protein